MKTTLSQEDRRNKGSLRRRKNDSGAASEDSDQGTVSETALSQRKKARGENTVYKSSAFQKDDSSRIPSAKESRDNISDEEENAYGGMDSTKPSQRNAQTKESSDNEFAGRDSVKANASNRATGILMFPSKMHIHPNVLLQGNLDLACFLFCF